MTEWEAVARVAIAAVLGGAIGLERELQDKEAGLRTHMLVALGSATFIVAGLLLIEDTDLNTSNLQFDPMKIMEGIIGGIGFLGGAIVFRREGFAKGVTTAAGIWTVTGLGIAAGFGYYILAVATTVLILIALFFLGIAERTIGIKEEDTETPAS